MLEGAQVGFTEKQEEAEDCLSSQPGTRHQPPHITFILTSHQSNIRCDSVAFEISPTAPRI